MTSTLFVFYVFPCEKTMFSLREKSVFSEGKECFLSEKQA